MTIKLSYQLHKLYVCGFIASGRNLMVICDICTCPPRYIILLRRHSTYITGSMREGFVIVVEVTSYALVALQRKTCNNVLVLWEKINLRALFYARFSRGSSTDAPDIFFLLYNFHGKHFFLCCHLLIHLFFQNFMTIWMIKIQPAISYI